MSPLLVNLNSGITDKGNKLKPIYGIVHLNLFQCFLNALVSFATSYALLSDSNPAIGKSTFEIILPLSIIIIHPCDLIISFNANFISSSLVPAIIRL